MLRGYSSLMTGVFHTVGNTRFVNSNVGCFPLAQYGSFLSARVVTPSNTSGVDHEIVLDG
jgi:hypothetical protein